jgi:4-amino-4-deoxy-L-arabinose transferase-like glycosyltransferase
VLAIVALALALRLWGVADAWSTHEWSGEFGAYATGTPARNFLEHGFLDSFGVPVQTRIELADGSVLRQYYLHHPPTYMWFAGLFLWLFGPVEWGLRLLAVFGSTAAAVAGYWFARRAVGERAALVGACVWIAAPYGLRDGLQLWTEVPIAGTSAMALLAYLRWLDGRERRRLVELCLWYGAGCALDWPAHFYGPVFALHALALAAARRDRGLLVAPLALFATSLASIAAVGLHFLLVVGRERLAHDFEQALGSASGAGEQSWWRSVTAPGFLAHQVDGWWHALTTPGVLLLLVGLAALPFVRRPARERSLLALALLPGAIYVLLFPGRSANHLFFLSISLPAFGALVGLGAESLARGLQGLAGAVRATRSLRHVEVACAGLAALAVVVAGIATHAHFRARTADDLLRRLVNEPALAEVLADPRAVVLAQPGRGAWLGFHSRAPVWMRMISATQLPALVESELTRLEPDRRAYVFVDLTAWQHPLLPEEQREHFRAATLDFEAAVASISEATVFEIVDDMGLTSRFGLYRLPTGGTPLEGPP